MSALLLIIQVIWSISVIVWGIHTLENRPVYRPEDKGQRPE